MSAYKVEVINGVKMMTPILTEEEYRALRGSTRQRELVNRARGGDQKAKRQLLQMNYSCIPGEDGKLKGCTQPSTTVGMDVDLDEKRRTKDEEQRIVDAILSKKEELGLLMLERSATKGYHLVFRRHSEMTQEENLRWASQLLGVQYDAGAKDITRVFFTTTDDAEDLIFLDASLFVIQRSETMNDKKEEKSVNYSQDDKCDSDSPSGEPEGGFDYNGIPYSAIIAKWWEMYYDGHEPVQSNRDTLTFELAVNLRNICGFDRQLMDQVIPCYDGFPHDQKMKCIDSALSEKRTQMPIRLKNVLNAVRRSHTDNTELMDTMDKLGQEDALFYYNRLPKAALPQGIADSIRAIGPAKTMPVLTVLAPAIGALATGVQIVVHGEPTTLNLVSYVVGEPGSGKGSLDKLVYCWMSELQAQSKIYTDQEAEWRRKVRTCAKDKKQPEEPVLPVRMLTLNNTVANLAERLANTQGMHAFSFTPEADTVAAKWKQSISDFSVMIRQSWDGSRYEREARSSDAVSVHIERLLWNVALCGTPDALYRVITNYTDGMLSRIAIAHMPDNTFSKLEDKPFRLTDRLAERIQQVAHLLPLLHGTVELPKLEQKSREWVEEVRLQSIKNDDKIMAKCRLRDHVCAQRMTACLMLCWVCERLLKEHGLAGSEKLLREHPDCWIPLMKKAQTPAMMQAYEVIADSILDNDLLYFRERMESAYKNIGKPREVKQGRKTKNKTIFALLGKNFTTEEALQQAMIVKGQNVTQNSVDCMLRNWEQQGLVERTGKHDYEKRE